MTIIPDDPRVPCNSGGTENRQISMIPAMTDVFAAASTVGQVRLSSTLKIIKSYKFLALTCCMKI